MIRLASKLVLMTAVVVPQAQPASYTGFAAHYQKGLMEAVARHRGIPPASCMVAHTYHPIGTVVDVLGLRTGRRLRCLVVDVPRPGRDRASIIRRHIITELDYGSNRVICGSSHEPPSYCPVVTREVP